mgnify:CR=1 FL=1
MNRDVYLDKILNYLVEDTRIESLNHIIFPSTSNLLIHYDSTSFLNPFLRPSFFDYCKDMYGLTKQEIIYLWDRYRNIMIDKMNNYE